MACRSMQPCKLGQAAVLWHLALVLQWLADGSSLRLRSDKVALPPLRLQMNSVGLMMEDAVLNSCILHQVFAVAFKQCIQEPDAGSVHTKWHHGLPPACCSKPKGHQ